MLPEKFKQISRELLGKEADDFIEAMEKPPVTSVRINRRKPAAVFPGARPVKWCKSGFYLDERPWFILDPLLHAGAYYVQDASSMIYETVVSILLKEMADRHLNVLDLCAAPGGKTTAIMNALPVNASVTANEISQKRVLALRENLAKWGVGNVRVTNLDSSVFAEGGQNYDIVAVDAPCSGEGMMRKDEEAVKQWSEKLVNDCAALQKQILRNAAKSLKKDGFLIYSTCTFNRKENEENAEFIRDELGLKPFDPSFPEEWGIMRGIETDLPVYRFMPHRTEGEGLFLAVFRKESVESDQTYTDQNADGNSNQIKLSGKFNKKNKIQKESGKIVEKLPEIEEILRWNFHDEKYPKVELDADLAARYLRRESLTLPPDAPKGYIIVTYKGLALGMAKNIGSRANNLYPKNWRILMR